MVRQMERLMKQAESKRLRSTKVNLIDTRLMTIR